MIAGPLLLAVSLLSLTARASPVSLRTYTSQVHLARVSLDRAMHTPSDRADVDRAARILRGLNAVRMPGGDVLHTDTPARAARLFPISSDSINRVAAWLDTLDDSLQRTQPRAVPASQLRELDSVLRDSRFHPVLWPWERALQWLVSLYHQLLRDLSGALRPGRPTAVIPAAILLLMVVVVGYLIARGAMGKLVVERSAQEEYEAPTTPAAAGRRAGDLAAEGNYRDALRYLFLSTMLQLQEHGLIELRPGMTNREYLRALVSSGSVPGPVADPLSALVDRFDDVWYGHRSIDAAGYQNANAAASAVLSALKSRAA